MARPISALLKIIEHKIGIKDPVVLPFILVLSCGRNMETLSIAFNISFAQL